MTTHLATPGSAAWQRQRRENVARFLADRGLDPAALADLLHARVGPGQLLLTSSPVHGLANPSSDLDFIRVVAGSPLSGDRIAAKLFVGGHHLEVVSYAQSEVDARLAGLRELAGRPPAELVAGFRGWDARFEPRRKQTERIVNGVTLDGQLPYLDALPALGRVWSRAALHTALEQVTHVCLAEAAGEVRGRVGYAVNAVLHLADALLAGTGDVYTTRKWFLLRWARAGLAGTAADPAVRAAAQALDRLRRRLGPALRDPDARLAGECVAVAELAVAAAAGPAPVAAPGAAASGQAPVVVRAGTGAQVRLQRFLPGTGMLLGPAGGGPDGGGRDAAVLVDTDRLPALRSPLSRLPAVSRGEANALLRALRAGLATVEIEYPTVEEGA